MNAYQKLEERFRQIHHLEHVKSIALWDEAVMMPTGGSQARNNAMAELVGVIESLIRADEVGEWLEKARASREPLGGWQQANLREMQRLFAEKTAVPADLSQHLVLATMKSEQEWRKLRMANDWKGFLPLLDEVLKLNRDKIKVMQVQSKNSIYDTALEQFSPGLNTKTVETLFNEIKSFLPDLIREVVNKQAHEHVDVPHGSFPVAAQKSLGLKLMKAVGFSMDHGRLDESFHPFCGGTPRDVRITTRYAENEFISSLMGVLHETGHALYEQNLPEEWLTQPVGQAAGMAIHESQSLMMEMQICRSREFLEFARPFIEEHMVPFVKNPEALSADNLTRLITRVSPGLIRVNADEVTYPAHIILRFEIERDLLEDRWPLAELPNVWNEKMKAYLGLSTFGNDKDGCMQDVHWPSGAFGYFPAYTFGAVIAAQLFVKIQEQFPMVKSEIAKGKFDLLHEWLKKNIWSKGASIKTLDLVEHAAGPLTANAFQKHLETRYLR